MIATPGSDTRTWSTNRCRCETQYLAEGPAESAVASTTHIEKSWLPPFVAVLDRNGLVLWQEQGVTRWDAVPCGT
jgi:hypothetical protein